ELPSEEWTAQGSARRSGQSDGQLPWSAPLERDASEHDGPRGAVGQEGQGQRGPSVVHGPRPDGEPQRTGGGLSTQPGDRHGRTRYGAQAGRPGTRARLSSADIGGRQKL